MKKSLPSKSVKVLLKGAKMLLEKSYIKDMNISHDTPNKKYKDVIRYE